MTYLYSFLIVMGYFLLMSLFRYLIRFLINKISLKHEPEKSNISNSGLLILLPNIIGFLLELITIGILLYSLKTLDFYDHILLIILLIIGFILYNIFWYRKLPKF